MNSERERERERERGYSPVREREEKTQLRGGFQKWLDWVGSNELRGLGFVFQFFFFLFILLNSFYWTPSSSNGLWFILWLGGSPLPISTVLWFSATAYCEGGRQLVCKKNHREIKIGKGEREKKKKAGGEEREKKL